MRRRTAFALVTVVLAAAGFAVASIASGARLVDVLTGTTGTTATTATTSTTSTTPEGEGGRKVTVCKLTGSRKHPAVTITVSQHAVASVLKGGGHLGPCTGTETPRTKKSHGSDDGQAAATTSTTTTTSSGDHGKSGDHGGGSNDGQGSDHGNGSGSSGHGKKP